mmetsp:Transcript_19510/g.54422  ORF Transcript_19510/g.54422 Transcript_19510/m.54422 type:complete len:290 (+) Transcript_19510:579-1448(+)
MASSSRLSSSSSKSSQSSLSPTNPQVHQNKPHCSYSCFGFLFPASQHDQSDSMWSPSTMRSKAGSVWGSMWTPSCRGGCPSPVFTVRKSAECGMGWSRWGASTFPFFSSLASAWVDVGRVVRSRSGSPRKTYFHRSSPPAPIQQLVTDPGVCFKNTCRSCFRAALGMFNPVLSSPVLASAERQNSSSVVGFFFSGSQSLVARETISNAFRTIVPSPSSAPDTMIRPTPSCCSESIVDANDALIMSRPLTPESDIKAITAMVDWDTSRHSAWSGSLATDSQNIRRSSLFT